MNEARISRWILIACLGSAGACAGSAHNAAATQSETAPAAGGMECCAPTFPAEMPPEGLIVSAEGELTQALEAGASCDLVATLRDRICALAERICTLSSETPEDETMRAQCEDGANRCLSATSNVRDRCGP